MPRLALCSHVATESVARRRLSLENKSISPARYFVHRSVTYAFIADFVRHTDALRVDDGLQASSRMGPLANARRVQAMTELAQDAVAPAFCSVVSA